MLNFEFNNTARVIFGKGNEYKTGEIVKKYADNILFHYGEGSIKKTGIYDKIVKSLKESKVEFIELGGVKPNPRLSLVYEGIKLCRENKIELVLAVGGGSVIDSAKAIAMGALYDGDVWNFYTGNVKPKKALHIGIVLTIPAAGSETNLNSVITKEEGGLKRTARHELLRPKFAILNPELTFTLSPYQTACGIVDMLTHVMERYFTPTRHVDFTDRLCEATMKAVIEKAYIVLKEPDNYDARADIMWAGCFINIDILANGRMGDWASHAMEHELSGIYDIAHGAGLAVIFPPWLKYVYRNNPDKNNNDKFLKFASRVWNEDIDFEFPERTALKGIKRLEDFYKDLGLATTLKGLDIGSDRIEEMAEKCRKNSDGTLGNYVKLAKQDIINILQSAL